MINLEDKDEITSILINLKIHPKMSGFDYIREAVSLCLKEPDLLRNITTKMYPMLSEKFKVKASIIERCIRFAINSAYDSGGLLNINQFYDVIVYTNDFKYPSSELIAIITEKVRLDMLTKYYIKQYKKYKTNI